MSYGALLDEVAILSRAASGAQNAAGEEIRSFTTVATGVPCSVQSPAGSLVKTDAGRVSRMLWSGFVLPSVGVLKGDRLAVTARGLVFEVVKVEKIRGRTVQVDLRELAMTGLP